MQFYESNITVFLRISIPYDAISELLAVNINRAMFMDEALARFHEENRFKNYSYSQLFPIEQDKLYKAGKVYVFKIRGFDAQFINKIKINLRRAAEEFQVLAAGIAMHRYRFINELITLTPALATVNGRYWIKDNDLLLLRQRIQNNLLKKYYSLYHEELEPREDFIRQLEILNRKPIALKYKSTKLIGNKFRILVGMDDISQKLAFTAMGSGLLEKNSSLGLGFCIAR